MQTGILCTFIFFCGFVQAQQALLRNGDFESHGALECVNCYQLYGRYPSVVYHWDNGGWQCSLWDKTLDILPKDDGFWSPFPRIQPHTGNCMVEMCYYPKINGVNSGASHLTAQSLQLLEVGKTYEVSFYLYIDSVKNQDPEWAKYIGIALLPEKISFNNLSGTRVIPNLPIDTVVYKRWYQVKWRVRPLCNSQYLMIGVFRTKTWPRSQAFQDAFYYIDDVSMHEIQGESVASDSTQFYCSRYDPAENPELKPQFEALVLHFETNIYSLNAEHKNILKTFAQKARKHPDFVFEISGHTDSTGSNNYTLAQNRILATLNYLCDSLQLPRLRFLERPLASSAPLATNAHEQGRALNRRVEIAGSNLSLPMFFYRKAIEAADREQKQEAYAYLKKWLQSISTHEHISIQFDPRFDNLKYEAALSPSGSKVYDKRWLQLLGIVGKSYQSGKSPQYNRLLDSLHMEYLRANGKLGMVLDCYTGSAPYADSMTLHIPALSDAAAYQHHKALYQAIRPMLEKSGWPKSSKLGSTSANLAFGLIYRGADHNTLQEYLPKLKKLCENGEADWVNYAMLFDRCELLEGRRQQFGTQYEYTASGDIDVLPWSGDKDTINARRAAIGLPELPLFLQEIMFFE